MLSRLELIDAPLAAPANIRRSAKAAPSRILELDGLRGLAILCVVVFHYYDLVQPPSAGRLSALFWNIAGLGWAGVDLFFVLSGCLITGILLKSKDSAQYFKFFYMRRVLRILPLYYFAVLVFFWIYLPLVHAAVER
jgi:peptidoglycan/LPS O-acetylase OafA/YrhL